MKKKSLIATAILIILAIAVTMAVVFNKMLNIGVKLACFSF